MNPRHSERSDRRLSRNPISLAAELRSPISDLRSSRISLDKGSRIAALDMTKGVLVVFMVIYHSLNYSTMPYVAFQYMAFLPPSFILIVGFLLSNVYCARYDSRDWKLHRRLLIRGAKLLALFTILNVAAHVIRGQNYNAQPMGVRYYFDHWNEVYVLGTGSVSVFEVLLPIAYLLILAPGLILVNSLHRLILPALTVALLATCAILERSGASLPNFYLLSAGILGMLVGRVPVNKLDLLGRYWPGPLLVYCGYFALGNAVGQSYLIQLLGACAALAVVYGFCILAGEDGWFQTRLVKLGNYSLVGYIAQIALLQALVVLIGRTSLGSVAFFFTFLSVLILTIVLVEIVDWARDRSSAVKALYKAVFA